MKTTADPSLNIERMIRIALVTGLAAAVLAVVGLFISGPAVFFQAYLYSFLFWLGISLGCLAILLLHFTVSSRWGVTIRRITEAGAGSIWVLALLFVPLLFGLSYLFPWARPGAFDAASHGMQLQFKQIYLSVPFFIIRALIYFVAWGLLAFFANRQSARLNTSEANLVLRGRLQGLGAFGMIIYLFTMTFAAVDWSMSLQPFWNSTVYGLLSIIGQILSALSFAVLVLNLIPALSLGRRWDYQTTPVPYRDLGALLMTLVMGWAYLAYFQMLIIWSGNIPREVVWYLARIEGGWNILAIIITVFQFALPFLMLLSIRARHSLKVLAGLGGMLLLVNLLNMFWQIKPAFTPGQFSISWLDIVMPVALGGLWMAGFLYLLRRRPVLTLADQESLGFLEGEESAARITPERTAN
ncbi:MAG: hypothetical protein IH586_15540 [Anaerolineaceae bacterium]|nr:hypothetical protein [Anaerolineaceae bacterium]